VFFIQNGPLFAKSEKGTNKHSSTYIVATYCHTHLPLSRTYFFQDRLPRCKLRARVKWQPHWEVTWTEDGGWHYAFLYIHWIPNGHSHWEHGEPKKFQLLVYIFFFDTLLQKGRPLGGIGWDKKVACNEEILGLNPGDPCLGSVFDHGPPYPKLV
jgi:hypothetical protein